MYCYYCGEHQPGGTRYGMRPAVGVCHRCGAGVCKEHSVKSEPGALLLCVACAALTMPVIGKRPQREEKVPV